MSLYEIPATPRVISPSPTPSESQERSQDGYFGPTTRSSAKKRISSPAKIDEGLDDEELEHSPELRRARSKSREPMRTRRMSGLTETMTNAPTDSGKIVQKTANGSGTNGHLSPYSAVKNGWSWRDISRSPSPLGLIPIHRHWRSMIHRHEVPRKLLHVSIGFFAIWAYVSGMETNQLTPYIVVGLIPIVTADYLRFTFPAFNRVYVQVLGALMRETEYNAWNGVIWYMIGVLIILSFFPKDIAIVGTLLLSWCDTAASTIGRAYGRYTPRIRKGKSLAGSLAAFLVGIVTAAGFWGWLAPYVAGTTQESAGIFMFTGTLMLPNSIRQTLHLTMAQSSITGGLALAMMSIWTGFVASASEVVDIFGLDDNLTIPVLSGFGIWAFLKIFG